MRRRTRRRLKLAGIATAATAILAFTGAIAGGVLTFNQAPPPVSDKVAEYYANPPRQDKVGVAGTLAVVGDSFSLDQPKFWMHRVASCLNYDLVVNSAGGTGFFNPGESSVPFGDPSRMKPIVDAKPDLVIFETAYNDSWRAEWDPATVTSSAVSTIEAYRDALPNAKFVLVGPFWAQRPVPARIDNNRTALEDAASQSNTPFFNAVDWLPTTDYVGGDLLHPNDKGHQEVAAKVIASLISSKVVKSCA